MPHISRHTFVIIALLACTAMLHAQDIPDQKAGQSTTVSIVDHITSTGTHSVTMPDALKLRMQPMAKAATSTTAVSTGGYRIQVFSDSNPRSAQGEARGKASNISSQFPQWRTYVTYDAPYWRLRVGDFTNYEDANDALSALKKAFPAYKRELRIVRDHINHSGN